MDRLVSAIRAVSVTSAGNDVWIDAISESLTRKKLVLPTIPSIQQFTLDGPSQWKSEIGSLFLDRTRESPSEIRLGEDVYVLPLGPGEEVVFEQRAFTKRQIALEDVTEVEQQKDLELSSSLSTEMQEGLERSNARNASSGVTAGGQLGLGPPVANIGVSVGFTSNTSEANNESRSLSVKRASDATTKLAAKYRSLHRLAYKVSTEYGFESTSKRIVKNPAKYSGIDLAYFKILRRVRLRQERYGIRLCWAATVRNPGGGFRGRIDDGRRKRIQDVTDTVFYPAPPPIPVQKTSAVETATGQKKIVNWSIGGGTDRTEEIVIAAPSGKVWDGQGARVKASLRFVTSMHRPRELIPLDEPRWDGTEVKLLVRVKVVERDLIRDAP
ncbi:hypothetical protein [Pseudarthrobacter sp. GA104]|uniref:hypothetical protein n=1 Tax=Pseudarthrobacter sp. GA104 TaxID=2676311 RepID=UPI0012F77197|nr:hypothetical protein [Pseudarthrobacter sp. GA104]MUU73416.1 hypothetical protein [Pseudarthrobacter sp. GA104]